MSEASLRAVAIAKEFYFSDQKMLCVNQIVGGVLAPILPSEIHLFG